MQTAHKLRFLGGSGLDALLDIALGQCCRISQDVVNSVHKLKLSQTTPPPPPIHTQKKNAVRLHETIISRGVTYIH